MPAGGFLALLDDISSLLDDIASMTKIAAGKTSAIVGDDLALNAKQLINLEAHRELTVVYAVAKGSLKNKAILVPLALAISAVAPFLITPLLMVGGLFLCYEGVEKLLHTSQKSRGEAEDGEHRSVPLEGSRSIHELESEKIESAIRTDFILSAEIIAIALGAAASTPFLVKGATLILVSLGMTVVVYGLVAVIVKADDMGLYLIQSTSSHRFSPIQKKLGWAIIRATPRAMRVLSVVGTLAMFSVGGGILAHGVPGLEHAIGIVTQTICGGNEIARLILFTLAVAIFGLLAGFITVMLTSVSRRFTGTNCVKER